MDRRRASFVCSIAASIGALGTGAILVEAWTRLPAQQNDVWYVAYWSFTALALVFAVVSPPGPRRRGALALALVGPTAQLVVAAYVLMFNRPIL